MPDIKDLELMLKSRVPIIVMETREEIRALEMLKRLVTSVYYQPLFGWSVSKGLHRLDMDAEDNRITAEPKDMLGHIKATSQAGIYALMDVHPYLEDPLIVRMIREIAQGYNKTQRTLVLISPELTLPAELQHHSARFEFKLPGKEEIRQLVLEEVEDWKYRNRSSVRGDAHAIDLLLDNLLGLSHADVKRLIRNVIYDDGAITHEDVKDVMQAKYQLLGGDGVLSFEADTAHFSDVAGLSRMKHWLQQRKKVFTADNPPRGLDMPRGMLLLGIQGAGKSLAAKAVAGAWQVPLLRLDFATLYNKYYGETERNLRQALKTARAMSPCVLWVDEIEKGLATDMEGGGPSKRILGTLLTWMAERNERVFLVATANDIEALPPELMRKGRFDEIFFVDLPSATVREQIFFIHLQKRDHDPQQFDLQALSTASDGFSGAEIEQAVVSALYTAHAQEQALSTSTILDELSMTRPLSVVMAEKVSHLRQWAAQRTVPAD
jgi:SpoVK/Ycf46/Vps4 family AAA+-type ATPase